MGTPTNRTLFFTSFFQHDLTTLDRGHSHHTRCTVSPPCPTSAHLPESGQLTSRVFPFGTLSTAFHFSCLLPTLAYHAAAISIRLWTAGVLVGQRTVQHGTMSEGNLPGATLVVKLNQIGLALANGGAAGSAAGMRTYKLEVEVVATVSAVKENAIRGPTSSSRSIWTADTGERTTDAELRTLLQLRMERIQSLESEVKALLSARSHTSALATPPVSPIPVAALPPTFSPPVAPPTFVQREMQGAIAKLDVKLQVSRQETENARDEASMWKELAKKLAKELGEAKAAGGKNGGGDEVGCSGRQRTGVRSDSVESGGPAARGPGAGVLFSGVGVGGG